LTARNRIAIKKGGHAQGEPISFGIEERMREEPRVPTAAELTAWYRARFLRRYVRAARRALGRNQIEPKFRDQSVDFLEWAAAYIDQLDPLSATARNPDQLPEPTHYHSDDEALKKTLLRLFGFDGRTPPKLTNQSQADGQENADDEAEDFEDE
jgi:hypothetical protein